MRGSWEYQVFCVEDQVCYWRVGLRHHEEEVEKQADVSPQAQKYISAYFLFTCYYYYIIWLYKQTLKSL